MSTLRWKLESAFVIITIGLERILNDNSSLYFCRKNHVVFTEVPEYLQLRKGLT